MPELAEMQQSVDTTDAMQSERVTEAAGFSADHLAYLADMLAELQEMAHGGGLTTLATILGLAVQEAHRQTADKRLGP